LRNTLFAARNRFTGQIIVLPSDGFDAYEKNTQEFFDQRQPTGITGKQLMQTIAGTSWRMNRIAALESNLLTPGVAEHQKSIDTDDDPQGRTALAMAYREQSHVLAKLGAHELRLSRTLGTALRQLRELQFQRSASKQKTSKNEPNATRKERPGSSKTCWMRRAEAFQHDGISTS
jgi:hypothetical protein